MSSHSSASFPFQFSKPIPMCLHDPIVNQTSPPICPNWERIFYTTPIRPRDFFGKGNQQPAKEAQKALGSLAGVVALEGHADLHNTPAQDDDANGTDAGEK